MKMPNDPVAEAVQERIGRQLVELRTERGLSQGDAAQAMGVAQSTLSCWERGTTNLDIPSLLFLARQLGIGLHEFFCPFGENSVTPSTAVGRLPGEPQQDRAFCPLAQFLTESLTPFISPSRVGGSPQTGREAPDLRQMPRAGT